MGLITKEVEVQWNARMKNHYESRRYVYTKFYDCFTVSIDDLLPNSNKYVDVKCDGCGDLLNMTYQAFNKCVKENGEYYCTKCMNKLFVVPQATRTKLKNSKSFAQWCIDNNREDVLKKWDYNLNKYSPFEITYSSGKKCWFKCSNNTHDSELYYISNVVRQGLKCKQCNSFAQWGIDNICKDFLKKYWDYEKNNISPWKIAKSTANTKIWIKCQEKDYHGSYDTTPNVFVTGVRCGFCTLRPNKIHPYDSLGAELTKRNISHLFSDLNNKSAYEYPPSGDQIIWWKCENEVHKDYKKSINKSNTHNFRCPECVKERNESFLQEKVRLYFTEMKYVILHEYDCNLTCINPRTNYPLPFDNEVVDLNLIIEVHGRQHYELCGWNISQSKSNGKTPEECLEYQQWKDKYKKEYALSQGYFYLEIPYWADDKDESWKKLIDDKIKEIKYKKEVV